MKNFLKVIIITLSLSVTFLIGTIKVNAQGYDFNNVNLNNINLLSNATNKYIVVGAFETLGSDTEPFWDFNNTGRIELYFFDNDASSAFVNRIGGVSTGPYGNPICALNNSCFNEVHSIQGGSSGPKIRAFYISYDGGNSWTYEYGNTYSIYSSYPYTSHYIITNTLPVKTLSSGSLLFNSGYELDYFKSFNVDFEQGEAILNNTGGAIANLVTYYVEPNFDDFIPDNYIFSYIENTTGGGFRDSHQFNLTYVENGITYNGITYHYYYNLPLSYNTGLTFSITDLENTLIQENQFTAYLSSLTDISGYTMYDFRNYEFANMSDINTGSFGLSYQLNSNITINAINYNTNTKIDFLTSSYLINSHTDNNSVTWYNFDFNNEPIYLEFINNFNDTSDFYTFIDTYSLYLYFDNNAYVHLSGSPNSVEGQNNVVNQQSYKDDQGNIIYNKNPIIIDIDNSNEFFQNLQRYFKDFDNDTFGLTGIITSPLNLIQNLLSNTCNALVVPIPYVNSNLTLPCMSSIYSQYFGGFYTIYQDITFGIVAYWVIIRILNMVKDFRNPDHDEIEVLDL